MSLAVSRAPVGEKIFTTMSLRLLASAAVAVIRVVLASLFSNACFGPHSVAVTVDKWEETPKMTTIYATIHVERDGQKGIVIGSKGAMLKRIGTLAREEMERLFGVKIYLDLHVRVKSEWREDEGVLTRLGLD